jgi:putative flippase GtrA
MLPNRKTQVRFLQFIAVGGTGLLVQLSSLAWLKLHISPRRAYSIAYVLSVVTHYSLNRFWALPSVRKDQFRQFIEYLGTVGVSYLVSFAFFNLFYGLLGFSIMISTVISVPPATLFTFFLLNYRVFRHDTAA